MTVVAIMITDSLLNLLMTLIVSLLGDDEVGQSSKSLFPGAKMLFYNLMFRKLKTCIDFT